VASLSEQYKTAGSDAETGHAFGSMSVYDYDVQVNTFMLSYVVFSVSWIVISIAMLKSDHFGKPTSWAGIAAGACGIVAEIAEHASAHFKWIANRALLCSHRFSSVLDPIGRNCGYNKKRSALAK